MFRVYWIIVLIWIFATDSLVGLEPPTAEHFRAQQEKLQSCFAANDVHQAVELADALVRDAITTFGTDSCQVNHFQEQADSLRILADLQRDQPGRFQNFKQAKEQASDLILKSKFRDWAVLVLAKDELLLNRTPRDSQVRASILVNRGEAQMVLGDTGQMLASLEEALAIYKKNSATFSHRCWQCAARLMEAYLSRGDFEKCDRVFELMYEVPPPESALGFIGLSLVDFWAIRCESWLLRGEMQKAASALHRMEVSVQDIGGRGALILHYQRGRLAYATEEYGRAKFEFKEALSIDDTEYSYKVRLRLLGMRSEFGLALSNAALGESREAKAHLRQAMEKLELSFSKNVLLLDDVDGLAAEVEYLVGDQVQADKLVEASVANAAKVYGEDHYLYALQLHRQAHIRRAEDRLASRQLAQKALAIFVKELGNDSPLSLRCQRFEKELDQQ